MLNRSARARDLLAVKGYNTSATKLACYSGSGFDVGLRDAARADPGIQLFGLDGAVQLRPAKWSRPTSYS